MYVDPNGDSWWGWLAAAAVVATLVVASVVTCGGAAVAAGTACAIVSGGCTAVSATATVVTGAAVGASVAFATTAVAAASNSHSLEEFADYGTSALISTVIGTVVGGLTGLENAMTYCFVAGTLVAAETGNIPIEQIKTGDYVWAWDEETGDVALKLVVETYINETEELVHVFVNGEEIVATPAHPFYSPVKGWTDAVQLRAGDLLVLVNGEYVVVEKVQHELLESPIKVYNFQVEDYHTYYVASISVLVHNRCGSGYSTPKGGGGKTDEVTVGDTTVRFGHGGRHLEGTGLSTQQVHSAIANDAVNQNLSYVQSNTYPIVVNNVSLQYRAIKLTSNLINVGTYFLTQ